MWTQKSSLTHGGMQTYTGLEAMAPLVHQMTLTEPSARPSAQAVRAEFLHLLALEEIHGRSRLICHNDEKWMQASEGVQSEIRVGWWDRLVKYGLDLWSR